LHVVLFSDGNVHQGATLERNEKFVKLFNSQTYKKKSFDKNLNVLKQMLPTWGSCTPGGTFAYPKGYI